MPRDIDVHRLSKRTLSSINRILSPTPQTNSEVIIGMTISDNQGYSLRELSDYLEQVDRFFGRLTMGNLRKYSRGENGLYVRSIRPANSFEILLNCINAARDMGFIIPLGVLLQNLPALIKVVPEALNSFEDYLLKRDERLAKREERKSIASDVGSLKQLPAPTLEEAAQVLEKAIVTLSLEQVMEILENSNVYENFDEETKSDIASAIHSAISAEQSVNPRGITKAFIFNSRYSQEITITVEPINNNYSSNEIKRITF